MNDQIRRKDATRPTKKGGHIRQGTSSHFTASRGVKQTAVTAGGPRPKAGAAGASKESQKPAPGYPSAEYSCAGHQDVPAGLVVEVERDGDSMVFWFSGRAE